jgi:hypothetical protein
MGLEGVDCRGCACWFSPCSVPRSFFRPPLPPPFGLFQEKMSLLETLKGTVLRTIDENSELREHNATLKKVCGVVCSPLFLRIAQPLPPVPSPSLRPLAPPPPTS